MANRVEEALAWRERLKTDRSPETLAEHAQWMLDPENAREYEQQAKLDAVILAGRARGIEPEPEARRRRAWVPLAIGAGALAAAIAALMARPAGTLQPTAPPVAIAYAAELSRVRLLADGSVVILSAGARLGERPAGAARGATLLGGSARFIVVHDPAHPFVVRADGLTVTARGTIFDVDLMDGAARVSLVEGRIDIRRDRPATKAAGAIALSPGQVLGETTDRPQAAPSGLAARVKVIEADHLPLGDIVRIVNAQGGAQMVLADPALGARPVSGRFEIRDVPALGARLAAALGLRLIERDGKLVITPR